MNKKLRFFAQDIGFDSETALCVGFARDQSDERSDEAIVLIRGMGDDDEEDIYVEIPPQRFTTCGGIKRARLFRNRFEIEFGRDAMRDLNGVVSMDIGFDLDEDDYEAIREVLGAIFDGHAAYEESDAPDDRQGGAPGMPGARM